METYFSRSSQETFEIGRSLGKQLIAPCVICFFGELAAGKTTFIKGLVEGATNLSPSIVQSPTFTYLNIYDGKNKIFHFDLYRLRDIDEFLSMGFDEYFDADGICCIEWSERISDFLPDDYIKICLTHAFEDERYITLQRVTKEV
ncbi:MAG: tRNA (adenosine(37)-N6)-threonylcarbamoyltransferase complex ATPase subunit type 1 TsaE [Parachlamydiaceae bacterium]|nr:tRNA (adenosine(37)-N6)-threonylcarbamoyltransferase complex ATPase subunit type 1 TsaE [Parachlamydiaceae bacterium]